MTRVNVFQALPGSCLDLYQRLSSGRSRNRSKLIELPPFLALFQVRERLPHPTAKLKLIQALVRGHLEILRTCNEVRGLSCALERTGYDDVDRVACVKSLSSCSRLPASFLIQVNPRHAAIEHSPK